MRRRTTNHEPHARRPLISWFLIGIAILVAGCSTSGSAGTIPTAASPTVPSYAQPWPVRTGDLAGRALQLSQTTVAPGEIITRTISGANPNTDVTPVIMMLEHFDAGSWRLVYYLSLDQPPTDFAPAPNMSIPAIGIKPTPLQIRIPDVSPGTYRVRQDMAVTILSTPITLYATLQITAPATPTP